MRLDSVLNGLIVVSVSVIAVPAIAQVTLDNWDYNSKPELMEKLDETISKIDQKMDQARDNRDTGMLNDLKQARYDIESVIRDLRNVTADNWNATVNYLETKLNDPRLYNYGVFDGNFWNRNSD